jgi:hypothetical protein
LLANEPVGLEPLDEDTWEIFFGRSDRRDAHPQQRSHLEPHLVTALDASAPMPASMLAALLAACWLVLGMSDDTPAGELKV